MKNIAIKYYIIDIKYKLKGNDKAIRVAIIYRCVSKSLYSHINKF